MNHPYVALYSVAQYVHSDPAKTSIMVPWDGTLFVGSQWNYKKFRRTAMEKRLTWQDFVA